MKTLLLIALLVCFEQVNAQTSYVAIPDSGFVHYLKTIVPNALKGDSLNTSSTLVTTYTPNINVSNYYPRIANLNGIQYFTSLTYLNCYNNSLTSLPALPNTLAYLECENNGLMNLPSLPNTLHYLYCSNNLLTSLPTLPNSLRTLYCNGNSLTSASGFA